MTVTYTPSVANASKFCMFWKVLRIYRGSIYKIVWRELIFFIVIYLTIQFNSIYVFSKSQQLSFKRIRDSFYIKRKYIPMHFVLGFFVILVFDRWRVTQLSIPTADNFSLLVNSAIRSSSERSRIMRRTAVRFVIASFIINLRAISLKMRNRFPTFESIVNLGILLKDEGEILEKIEQQTLMTSYIIPLVWATNIIYRARKEGLINNDCIVQDLVTELGNYRTKLGDLLSHDMVCIPLFYVQVVTLSIYSYFFTTIIGHQVCCEDSVPIMEIVISLVYASLEFTFHIGWVKVAEVLINPFGEDEEDFEVDLMVDRNLKAACMIVDYMRVKEPDYHLYDYPVFNKMSNEEQHFYENIAESKNFVKENLYCSLEEDVGTQTEDKFFQMYENIPVTSAPLQLLTPSQSSSNVDYVNFFIKGSSTEEEISPESDTRTLEETNIYEQITDSENFKDNNLYCTLEEAVGTENKDKYFQVYEKIHETSAPLQLQNPSQSSSFVDYVNAIFKGSPSDEITSSEPNARTLEETNIYENITEKDNNLYCSLEEVVGTKNEDKYFHVYENVPVTCASLQIQTPPQSLVYVDYVNVIIKNKPTEEINSSDSDA